MGHSSFNGKQLQFVTLYHVSSWEQTKYTIMMFNATDNNNSVVLGR